MWNDQRSYRECEEITRIAGETEILRITGNPVLAGFTAQGSLGQNNEPEVFSSIDKVVLPKDYVRYKLSGEFFTDAFGCIRYFPFGRWQSKMVHGNARCIGMARSMDARGNGIDGSYGKGFGGSFRVNRFAGGHAHRGRGGDQAAQAVGCGIVREGMVSATLGTSGVVFAQSDEYRVEPEGKLHAFCHAVPGKWHLMGVMLSADGSFQWFKNQLGTE